jgi:hypothetical protein
MAYLLPCPQCGRKLVVTTGEAGGQMQCACGTAVDVPTVRGLRELEPATAPGAEAATSWTSRHSVIFLGSLMAIAGLVFGLILHFRAAALLPSATFADDIRTMAPAETWTIWTQFIRQGVGSWQPKKDEKQLSDLKVYDEMKRWEIIGFGLAGLGIVLAVIGVTMWSPKRTVPPKRPPRRPAASA